MKLFCSRTNRTSYSIKFEDETLAYINWDELGGRYFVINAGQTTCTSEFDTSLADAARRAGKYLGREVVLTPTKGKTLKNFDNQDCIAVWRTSLKGWQLCAGVMPGMSIHVILGWISLRNDGRWDYFVRPKKEFFCPVNPDGKIQGVVMTEDEARDAVEAFWELRS